MILCLRQQVDLTAYGPVDSGASQYGTSNKLLLKNIQSISGVNITAAFDTTVQP